jgi:hypothetical protein
MDFNAKKIYLTFIKEWINYSNEFHAKYSKQIDINNWLDFIKSKDLGIICVQAKSNSSGDVYKLIDEKKWLLAKIKYGF